MSNGLIWVVLVLACLSGLAALARTKLRRWELCITRAPSGEAPLWVREKWVGLALPLYQAESAPRSFRTSGVVSGPQSIIARMAARWQGNLPRKSGYVVSANDAMAILEAHAPDAALWWRSNAPHLIRNGRYFLFDPNCGTVRPRAQAAAAARK